MADNIPLSYYEAAQKIYDEIDRRGFTAKDILRSEGLIDSVATIIYETLHGKPAVPPPEPEDERQMHMFDGWEGDLINQN